MFLVAYYFSFVRVRATTNKRISFLDELDNNLDPGFASDEVWDRRS